MLSRRRVVVVGLAAASALLTACGGEATAVKTVTASAPPASTSAAASTPAETPSSAAPPAADPTTVAPSTAAAAPAVYVMPNEVGKVLQAAQNDMQVVTNNPLFYTSSSDATGAGRAQIIDSGWQVCTQNVPAGSQFTDADAIDFGVVRLSETCP